MPPVRQAQKAGVARLARLALRQQGRMCVRFTIAAALGEDLAAELAKEAFDDPQLDGAVRHRGIAERDIAHRDIAHRGSGHGRICCSLRWKTAGDIRGCFAPRGSATPTVACPVFTSRVYKSNDIYPVRAEARLQRCGDSEVTVRRLTLECSPRPACPVCTKARVYKSNDIILQELAAASKIPK